MIKEIKKADLDYKILQSLGDLGITESLALTLYYDSRDYQIKYDHKTKRITGMGQIFKNYPFEVGMKLCLEYDSDRAAIYMSLMSEEMSETIIPISPETTAPVEEIDFAAEIALIEAENELKNKSVSFDVIDYISYKNENYIYSGENKCRCVFNKTSDYPEFRINLEDRTRVISAWYCENKVFFLTAKNSGQAGLAICVANPGQSKICVRYDLDGESASSDTKMYAFENKSILFMLNSSCYLLKQNNIQKLFKHKMYFCELIYGESDDNGNISYLLFGRNTNCIKYIYENGNFIKVEDSIKQDIRDSFCSMIKSEIAPMCPEYLRYDLLKNADCSFDSAKNTLTFTTNCRYCMITNPDTIDLEVEETELVYAEFEPYSLMYSRDCNQYFYRDEEFAAQYSFADYEKEELPEEVLDIADFVFCYYIQNAIKCGDNKLIPSNEGFRSKIYWWGRSCALNDATVCAFAMPQTHEKKSYRCFGYLTNEDNRTVLKIAGTLAKLEAGKAQTVKSVFSDNNRKTVVKRNAFINEMKQNNYIILEPLAGILTSYRQKELFDSGNTDYLKAVVSAKSIASKIYCAYVMTDVSLAYIVDLSEYGLGKSEIISYDLRNTVQVKIKREGEMVPFEAVSLPDASIVVGFIPTLNNQNSFRITGASRYKKGDKLSYILDAGGAEIAVSENHGSPNDVYDNFSFYIKYQNGYLEHPLFNNIYAYCLLHDGIVVANSSGVYVIRENADPVKIPTQSIKLRDILKISYNNGILELTIFDELSKGYKETVLLQDYFNAVYVNYNISTHTVRISL